MKKILALLLAAVMVLSLAACTDKGSEGGATSPSGAQTNQPKSALEILEKVWSKYSTDEKFPATGGSEKHMEEDKPGKFDVSDAEALDFELGFPKDAAAEIDDAASLVHARKRKPMPDVSRRVVLARTVLPWEEVRCVGRSRAWPPRSRFGSSDRGGHPCGPNPTPMSQTGRRARTDAPPAQHRRSQRGCGSRPPAPWLGASVRAPSPSCIPRSWQRY